MRVNLKIERVKRGLTQKEVADQLGLTQGAYSLYELGKASPSLETAKSIANLFDKSIDYIFLDENTINNSVNEGKTTNNNQ